MEALLNFILVSHYFLTIDVGLSIFSLHLTSSISSFWATISHSTFIRFEYILYHWKALAEEETFLIRFIKKDESKSHHFQLKVAEKPFSKLGFFNKSRIEIDWIMVSFSEFFSTFLRRNSLLLLTYSSDWIVVSFYEFFCTFWEGILCCYSPIMLHSALNSNK